MTSQMALLLLVAQSPYHVVDVMAVRPEGDPSQWIRTVTAPANPHEIQCDILVAGAGMGGVAAAIRAAERGHSVCLTDPTDWIGGQATSGGVSALDENAFIERAGGTRSYYAFRELIRKRYNGVANPGACYVSSLCYEPKVGVSVLEAMLPPRVTKLMRTEIVSLDRQGDVIISALAYRLDGKEFVRIRARWYLDATELGDLLPLAKIPYVVGSESRAETGEPHAAEKSNTACVQSFTYPFAIERRDGENHLIEKPADYERIRDTQPFSLRMYYPVEFGWKGHFEYKFYGDNPPVPNNMSPGPFFSWRRLLKQPQHDIALMNWPRQDYHSESLLDRTPLDFTRILQQAKRVSMAFLYWMQKDLGHPEVMLRPDVMDTEDGLSKYPYIRESRRLKARATVREQDIVAEYQPGSRAKWFDDSIGIGFYMVDIHPCGANERARMMMPKPFQIPMGTLLPREPINLLAAGKNLGVTHITNGAFRLHPIEWNIGEAAAVIASLALAQGKVPVAVDLQQELAKAGVPLVWFDDLHPSHPDFSAIQIATIHHRYPLSDTDLHASPESPITRFEAARAFLDNAVTRDAAAMLAVEKGWMAVDHRNWFHGDLPFRWSDLREEKLPFKLPAKPEHRNPVRRAEFARLAAEAR